MPAVDIINDLVGFALGVSSGADVLANPTFQVIFEGSFDSLVQEIGGEQDMYVCTGEVCCEWLCARVS